VIRAGDSNGSGWSSSGRSTETTSLRDVPPRVAVGLVVPRAVGWASDRWKPSTLTTGSAAIWSAAWVAPTDVGVDLSLFLPMELSRRPSSLRSSEVLLASVSRHGRARLPRSDLQRISRAPKTSRGRTRIPGVTCGSIETNRTPGVRSAATIEVKPESR
jgi:hypothetical protein